MPVRTQFLEQYPVALYDKASVIIARSADGSKLAALCQRNRIVRPAKDDDSTSDEWVILTIAGQSDEMAFEAFEGNRESGGFASLWITKNHACVLSVPIGHRQVALTRTTLDTGSWCVSSGANAVKEKWVPATVLDRIRGHKFLKAAYETLDH